MLPCLVLSLSFWRMRKTPSLSARTCSRSRVVPVCCFIKFDQHVRSIYSLTLAPAKGARPKEQPPSAKADAQIEKSAPSPSVAVDKQSGSIPSDAHKEAKRDITKEDKEDKSAAPPKAPSDGRNETRVSFFLLFSLYAQTSTMP